MEDCLNIVVVLKRRWRDAKAWAKGTADEIRLRWQLAMYGEVMILNAIDAIDSAAHQLTDPVDAHCAVSFLDDARAHLKRVINYEDEPEPVYPDEEPMEANAIIGPRPRFIDEKEREDYGLLHVVPKDYAINQEHT